MLFRLDDSVARLLNRERSSSARTHAVDLLCLSVAEGKHRLTGDRETLRSLLNNHLLSDRTRAVLQQSLAFVETDLALLRTVVVYANVTCSEDNKPSSAQHGEQRIVNIPLAWIDDSAKVQATILLSENLCDAHLLERVVPIMRHIEPSFTLPIHMRLESGGGQTTADLFEHFARMELPCVCVVDSDKKAPNGSLGGTAAAFSGLTFASHPFGTLIVHGRS